MNTFETEFFSRVIYSDHCWEWVGAISPNGYGRLGTRRAHRLSYEYCRWVKSVSSEAYSEGE